MKHTIVFLLACCVFCSTLLFSQQAQAETALTDIIAAVEQSYNALSDLQASFSQKTFIPSMKREQKGSGKLSIKKNRGNPAMFRFDYQKPKQLIVSDGKSVWFYLPENRQVMVTSVKRLFEGGNGVTLNYLTGIGRISRDFTISLMNGGQDTSGNYLLELIPKTTSQNLAKLQLTVSAEAVDYFVREGKPHKSFPIVASVVYDSFGSRTAIQFDDVIVNRGLRNSLFTFKPPAGTEIIRQ